MSLSPPVPDVIRAYWAARPDVEHPTKQDMAWMEQAWGGVLPPDYRAFLGEFGCVSLEDAEGLPRWITYNRQEADGFTSYGETSLWTFLNRDRMKRDRAWLVEDAGGSLLPPGYIPVATGGGFCYFLLRLGAAPSPVYVWEDSSDPWGEGENTVLGHAADSLADFFTNLRIE